ncbi:hypothetical protein TUMSATVNIG1_04090 [Vibrio nigripulchritudo]|uniref:FG-GAP repeat domain-containing protein n=1 Tax=Vibrio nigripulchritudo TaxID=28173 RepID=UPI00190DA8BC|nr:VCBS repeat-containing protein [Vibrio nigripulchritudo]BCL68472.1 hypothetical protein VNTUMSATTG_04090 [Vibrio nigripulchritudo]BDU29800.1 hypothetical protein TUMSATVNIG1_04090 [Vibrio nigripulchritudo]
MLRQLKASSVLGIAVLLTACGGGGDSSSENGDTASNTEQINSYSKILKNATQHSESELKEAAQRLVEQGYSGKQSIAQLTPSDLINTSVFGISNIHNNIFVQDQVIDFIYLVDITSELFTCNEGGHVKISSTLNDSGIGTASFSFERCKTADEFKEISGTLALSSMSEKERTYYFDNLVIEGMSVTGYASSQYSKTGEYGNGRTTESSFLYTRLSSDEISKIQSIHIVKPLDGGVVDVEYNGKVWFSDFGQIEFFSQDLKGNYQEGTLGFRSNNEVKLTFSSDYFTYQEDIDLDGTFDLGTHLSKDNGFLSALNQPFDLYPLEVLTLPPAFTGIGTSAPTQLSYYLSTETPIVVESPEFSDPDTPKNELQITYEWVINDELIEGEATNTLPAYIASYGDSIKVRAVVFDGASSVSSDWAHIYISDTKPVIKMDNLPAQVFAGDELRFGVSLFDLDTNGSENVRIESGPDGATISRDGVVSWTAPPHSDFLFPVQTFEFTFKSINDKYEYEDYALEIEVSSNKANPIVRSGEYSPSKDDSIVIDDFDGDGLNDFLSTDNESGLSLYSFENGKYKQKWMYPYQLPSNGSIQHVGYLDVDNDLKKEIVIVTTKNIITLEDLSSKPTVVFEAPQNILKAAFADTDDDGELEVAILHYELYDSNPKLSIYGWEDFSFPIVNEFDAAGSSQLIYSNVDNDRTLELVLDGGLVIDTATWEVQWDHNGSFSESGMIIGDFNQDGVNEIIGNGSNNGYYRYSAVTNTRTNLQPNWPLSWCDFIKPQITIETTNVLLLDCRPLDGIRAFKVEGDILTQIWQLLPSSSYEINSLTVGDIDNDARPELLWGEYSKNGFVSAEFSGSSATFKHLDAMKPSSSFKAVGWAKVTPVKEEALFLAGSYNDRQAGNKFVTVNSDGDVKFGSGTDSDYTSSPLLDTTHIDSNDDGYSEVVLHNHGISNSQIEVVELANESVMSSHELSVYSGPYLAKSADFNQDGKKDVVFASGSQMTIYDVANNTPIVTHQYASEYAHIRDMEVYDETSGLMVVSYGYKLSLIQVLRNTVTVKSTYDNPDIGCQKALVFNYDSDTSKEIACFTGYNPFSGNQLLVFEIEGSNLILKESYALSFNTIGVAVNTSQNNEQGFFVTTRENKYFGSTSSYLDFVRKLNHKGESVWKGPPLIGESSSHGIKLRNHPEKGLQALVSTDQAMYQINP